MGKRIMRAFKLDEISAVDRPAQQGAKAVIMKRAGGVMDGLYLAKRDDVTLPDAVEAYRKRALAGDDLKKLSDAGECMADGAFPISNRDDLGCAIRIVDLAKDAAAAKNHIIARARALDATSLLPSDWRIGKSIGGDLVIEIARVAPRELPGLLDNVTKAEEIEAQVEKFVDVALRKTVLHQLGVAKSALIASSWSALDTASPADVSSVLRKNFDEYKDHVLGLVPGGEKSTKRNTNAGDDLMALKEFAKALGLKEDATEADITKALGELLTAAKFAKLDPAELLFVAKGGKMPSGGKDAFATMTAAERKAHMDANPADVEKSDKDEAITFEGQTIRKSVVGADQFAITKAMVERIQKSADREAVNTITKRIEPMKFVIGKADDTAALLHRIAKAAGQADADAVEALLGSANTVMAKSSQITREFGKLGGDNGAFAKAIDEIEAKAAELMKKDQKLTLAKARVMVRDANPDLRKREEDEAKEARKAA